ncbi:MAG: Gfo/Idh/MocA family oxidoreductase [Phycisphaerae bacterium]|nr:Gfo/Idh/MocA family oxidoreductase [Phycisphaerae bacterium]
MTSSISNQTDQINRRNFLKTNAAVIAGVALASFGTNTAQAADAKVIRFGFVGLGGRGRGVMSNLLSIKGTTVTAVCDIDPNALAAAKRIVTSKGHKEPAGYTGDSDYKKLMEREDVDAVIIATPWDLHTPMSVYSMKAGKPVGCEVPIAYTLEECWELIKTWEETGTPCMQMENWSFRPDNLAVLNMIRLGMLGRMTHGHCAYSHDCTDHWYFDSSTGNPRWGAQFLIDHNRAQYPTHQQGPMISWMDINCGDYYDTITSTATDCKSVYDYFERRFPGHPASKIKYKQGDIVTSVVRTKQGKTIVINYDMHSPRPYDNRWTVQGTAGIYNEQRDAVYLTGISPQYHQWESFKPYHEKYQHPWARESFGGHGGADGIMLTQMVKALQNKTQFPLSLYDGVLMAAVGPLSEMSIAKGSAPVKVPDFTRGKWKTRKPDFAVVDLTEYKNKADMKLEQIGQWYSGKITEKYAPMDFDITDKIDKSGKCMVKFQYTHGSHQLAIEKVQLICAGQVLATDTHRGITGINNQNNYYELDASKVIQGKSCLIRAFVQSEGGTDSNGKIYLIK